MQLGELKPNQLVMVSARGNLIGVCTVKKNYRNNVICSHLVLYQETKEIFFKFLNKAGSRRSRWADPVLRRWKMEYGILIKGYEVLNKDPQELERILMVAKTRADLKIHLGVS